ncbi:MAG: PQQ-binding-like beta-propeller repeat protein [Verrucomicrobia bacterium]|nr:PQQ-binding-like beta-propeller repeat protein [Verrucomicrobiota bacterium]
MSAINPPAPAAPAHAPLPLHRRLRWWLPVILAAAAAGNVYRLRAAADLDTMTRNFRIMLTLVGAAGLLLVWWLFLTRLRWRARLAGLGLVIVCGVGAKGLVRIDGSADGGGRPRMVWRWTPRRSGEVGRLTQTAAANPRAAIVAASDYPGYLGRDRSGVVTGVDLEPDWRAHPPRELWRHPIGLGWSGFAVAGSRAITQEQRGGDELVVCYDLASGRQVWAHAHPVRFSEPMGGDGPRATPTIDQGRVYAVGATGILDVMEAATGRLLWTRDVLKEAGLPNTYFGKSSSPLVVDDLVVVTGGMAKRSTLLAFHAADGAPAWRAGHDEASFTSPMLVTLAGRRQILTVNAATVTGQDPRDGRLLWEYDWGNNQWPKCAQPVLLAGDRLLLSASFNAGCVLLQVKRDADGRFTVAERWKNRHLKSEFSNLVADGGYVYGLDDGILACVDLATGQRKWKDGRYGHGQVLRVEDFLLVQAEPGTVALVTATPAGYHEVARLNALSTKTWNTPALAGNLLLVRNDQEAVCYRLPTRAAGGPAASAASGVR